jgi:hypothetical protein
LPKAGGAMTGNLGIGTSSPDGTLHVHSASAGSVTANSDADDLVVENSGHSGINILSPDANRSAIQFGHTSDNVKLQIRHDGGTSLSQIISDDPINIWTNGSERLRIDSSGNVGIGVTPEAWQSTRRALQIGDSTAVWGDQYKNSWFTNNVYRNSSNTESYINASFAGEITMTNGGVTNFKVAPSGSADAAISWIQGMSIANSGIVTKPMQPSFLVNGSPSKNGSNYVHSFGNIKHNIGSNYVNSTGRFTAPVAGRYLFNAGIWAQAGANAYMQIQVNQGGDWAGVHVGNSIHNSGTISVVHNLAANDYVSIMCEYAIQGSTPRNNFSGQLLG